MRLISARREQDNLDARPVLKQLFGDRHGFVFFMNSVLTWVLQYSGEY